MLAPTVAFVPQEAVVLIIEDRDAALAGNTLATTPVASPRDPND
jgi:hypothetical protein